PPRGTAFTRMSPCWMGRSVITQMSSGSPSPTMSVRPVRSMQNAATSSSQKVWGDEAVQRRADVAVLLRAIHAQDARALVHLVLHRVGGNDLHVDGDHLGRFPSHGHAVPGVGTVGNGGGAAVVVSAHARRGRTRPSL